MKKTGCLNSELSYVIAKLGHSDTITIAGCGLPVPDNVQRIDLAVNFGVPTFYQVFEVVDMEADFQRVIVSADCIEQNPDFIRYIKDWACSRNAELRVVQHEEFKNLTSHSKAVVRTGEANPFSNVILESAITY